MKYFFHYGNSFLALSLKSLNNQMKLTLWDICSALSTSGSPVHYSKPLTYIHTQKNQGCSVARSRAAALMFLWLFCQPVQGAEFNKAPILPNIAQCCSCTGNTSWYWKTGMPHTSLEAVLCSSFCPNSCLTVKSSFMVNSIRQLIWAEIYFTCWVVLYFLG